MMLVLLEDTTNKSFQARHIKTKISLKTMNAKLICKQGFLRICKAKLACNEFRFAICIKLHPVTQKYLSTFYLLLIKAGL